MAKQQAEQQLRDQQYQLKKERKVMKLQLQQQEKEELRLLKQKKGLKNKRKKAEADKNQRLLKLDLANRSLEIFESVGEEVEGVGSNPNQERTAGLAESRDQQSIPHKRTRVETNTRLPNPTCRDNMKSSEWKSKT